MTENLGMRVVPALALIAVGVRHHQIELLAVAPATGPAAPTLDDAPWTGGHGPDPATSPPSWQVIGGKVPTKHPADPFTLPDFKLRRWWMVRR